MTAEEFDAVLEEVVAYLDNPPAEESAEGRRFDRLLQMLQGHPVPKFEASPDLAAKDEARGSKLTGALERAASLQRKPAFGERNEGIGPTLGMDLS